MRKRLTPNRATLTPILIALLTLLPISEAHASSSFCAGFKEGYKQGYCSEKTYGCLEPMIPMCPLAGLGEDTFKDGFTRGFLQGQAKAAR